MLEDLQVLLTAPSSVSSSSSSSIATDAEVAVGVVSSVTPSSLSGTSPTPTTQSTSDNIQSTMAALPVLPSASAEPLVHVSNDGPSQVVNTLFDHPNISSFDSHNDTSKNSTSFISIESLNTDSDLERLEREIFFNDSSHADVNIDAKAALAALNASILAANLSKSGNSLVVSPVHPSSSNVFVALTSRLKDLEVDRAITHTHISETNDALLALARQIDTIQKSLIALRNQSFGVRHSATVDELVDSIVSTRDEVHSSEERHNSDVSYLRKQVDLLEARLRDAEQKAETMIWNAEGSDDCK
jgi:uncharacterized coiled-coil protein SlyX